MKKVVSKSEVAHLFAHQSQDEARVSGGNFYFNGDTIYSYGSHFPIAKHVTNSKGVKGLLFTTQGYSPTTTSHLWAVDSATSHLNKIHCYNPECSHNYNIDKAYEEIKEHLESLARARKPEKYIVPAEQVLSQITKYCEFFSVDVPQHLIEAIETAKGGGYADYLLKESERIAAEKKKVEQKRNRLLRKDVKDWKAFDKKVTHLNRWFDRDYLRIDTERGTIETSQRIDVPFEKAKAFYRTIKIVIAKGGCTNCDTQILSYGVNEINDKFIKVGCHTIDMKEIELIATRMNWNK